MLKVGLKPARTLFYGAAARLRYAPAAPAEFGYYDADRSFVPLAVTDEQRITVTVDSNAYVPAACAETRPTNYSTILGAYHIELLTAFGSYEESAFGGAELPRRASSPTSTRGYRVRVGDPRELR